MYRSLLRKAKRYYYQNEFDIKTRCKTIKSLNRDEKKVQIPPYLYIQCNALVKSLLDSYQYRNSINTKMVAILNIYRYRTSTATEHLPLPNIYRSLTSTAPEHLPLPNIYRSRTATDTIPNCYRYR